MSTEDLRDDLLEPKPKVKVEKQPELVDTPTMTSTSGSSFNLSSIGVFNSELESFEAYSKRVKIIFKANNIPGDKHTLFFLSVVGAEVFTLINDLCSPTEPESMALDQIIEKLMAHFRPKTSIIYERYVFHSRVQGPSESIADFVAALKKQAIKCEFKTFLDESLRDQVVRGLKSTEIQQHLFTLDKLDFDTAVAQATSREVAKKEAGNINNGSSKSNVVGTLNRGGRKPHGGSKDNNHKPSKPCEGCNGQHFRSNCPFKDAKCHGCGLEGHLRRCCRSSGSRGNSKGNSKKGNYKGGAKKSEESTSKNVGQISSNAEYIFQHTSSDIEPPVTVQVELNGVPCDMEWDTGAPRSIMPYGTFKDLFRDRVKLKKTSVNLRGYGGKQLLAKGEAMVTVNLKQQNKSVSKVLPLVVVDIESDRPTLFGRGWMRELGFNIEPNHLVVSSIDSNYMQAKVQKFPNLFRSDLGCLNKFKVHIEQHENVQPRFFKARSIPFVMKEQVDEALDKLVQDGVIEPVTSSRFAAPIVPVRKANGKIRICGDYRLTANKAAILEVYPLPIPDQIFTSLVGGTKFSKLDMSQAYQQCPLDDSSKEITTINTPRGLFRYNRLCFGIASAPAIFQRTMDTLLKGIDGVMVFLDALLISGPRQYQAVQDARVNAVLQRLEVS